MDFPLEVRLERMTPCPSALDVAAIDAPRPDAPRTVPLVPLSTSAIGGIFFRGEASGHLRARRD